MKTNLNQFEIDIREHQLNIPLTCAEMEVNEQIGKKLCNKKECRKLSMLNEEQIRQVEHYLCSVCQHEQCGTHLCRVDHITYDEIEAIYNEKFADIEINLNKN